MPRRTDRSALRLGMLLAASQLVSHGLGLLLVGALLPFIAADLALGYDRLGMVVGASTLGYVIGSLAGGRLPPTVRPRIALIAVHLVLAALFVLLTVVDGFPGLLVINAGIGMAAAPGWISVVRTASGVDRRGFVLSMASSGGAVGVILNAGVLGLVADQAAWRAGFWMAAIASLAVAAAFVLGRLPDRPRPTAAEPALRQHHRPMRVGGVAVAVAVLAGLGVTPFLGFLVTLTVDEFGRPPGLGVVALVLAGLAGIVSAPIMGRVIDGAGPVRALRVGAIAMAGSLAALAIGWIPPLVIPAVISFGFLNYPVWAVIGAAVERATSETLAPRVMSWAMVGFGVAASGASTTTGWWYANEATFRHPVMAYALACGLMAALAGGLQPRAD
jgi:MFS family permease